VRSNNSVTRPELTRLVVWLKSGSRSRHNYSKNPKNKKSELTLRSNVLSKRKRSGSV
jgi:hypothetical protein